MKPLHQIRIIHRTRLVNISVLIRKDDLTLIDLDFCNLFIFRHGHKRSIVHFPDLTLCHPRNRHKIQHHQQQKNHNIIEDQRFFRCFYFIHTDSPFLFILLYIVIILTRFLNSVILYFYKQI